MPLYKGKVYQYDLEGNFICEYEHALQAAELNNAANGHLLRHLKGISHHCKKKIYSYKYYLKLPSELLVNKKSKFKPIDQFTLDGQFVKSFKSIKEACLELNIPHCDLSAHLTRGKKTNGKLRYETCRGYIWKYKK